MSLLKKWQHECLRNSYSMNEKYSDGIQSSHWKYHGKRSIDTVGGFFIPFIKNGACGLDAGCGTGSITASMLKYVGEDGKMVGIDINAEALEVAREKYPFSGLQFTEGNLYNLPFEDNTFDFVFSHGVLIHCKDPSVILKELLRVLKPDGAIGISAVDHDSILIYPDDSGLLKKSIELQEKLWEAGSGWGATADEGSNLHLGKALCRLLVDAGFSDVVGYARCECYGDKKAISGNAESEISTLTSAQFIQRALELSLVSKEDLDGMVDAWKRFSVTSGAFRVKTICEATATK